MPLRWVRLRSLRAECDARHLDSTQVGGAPQTLGEFLLLLLRNLSRYAGTFLRFAAKVLRNFSTFGATTNMQ
jgi:hypothetical protein